MADVSDEEFFGRGGTENLDEFGNPIPVDLLMAKWDEGDEEESGFEDPESAIN